MATSAPVTLHCHKRWRAGDSQRASFAHPTALEGSAPGLLDVLAALDGTPQKVRLGGNAIVAASLAVAWKAGQRLRARLEGKLLESPILCCPITLAVRASTASFS